MKNLKSDDPKIYEKLKPQWEGIDASRNRALWIGWGSVLGGIGMIALALGPLHQVQDVSQSVSGATVKTRTEKPNGTLGIAGLALLVIGPIVGVAMHPKHDDYLDLINEHNQINPRNPLKLTSDISIVPLGQKNGDIGLQISTRF